jgi:alpha/beta superfamily hydrolase
MRNNVTRALAQAFLDLGMTCLRFNFRGTGRSQGSHSGGEAEIDDVKSALDFLMKRRETDAGRLVLAGYSFGCWTALRAAAADSRPSRLIGISPPLDMYDFGFLDGERRPLLLAAGDRDFVCDAAAFKALAERLEGPHSCVTLPGADHFLFGRETKITELAKEFLAAFPWEGDR